MAKITKTQLKGIVKECLVEILSEGLDSSGVSSLSESKKKSLNNKRMLAEQKRLKEHRKSLDTRLANTVATVTDDPIMQAILTDTAKTTLQEQAQNEPPGSGNSSVGIEVGSSSAGINLDSIFESPSQNWADLAFNEAKT